MDSKMPACVWPEWEFTKQIGRGSFGTVYEAVRHDDYGVESRAAIKLVSIPQNEAELDTLRTEGLDYTASRTYMRNLVDAFINEVKLMITFKGVPNIVSVEDYKVVERQDEIGWDISIRMELLTPLSSYIADKKLTESEVAKIGIDICSALEICEKKNVIHRDIKPANIFINEFGDYKLGDFGIARQMESMTTDLSRKGTGSYMAPEVERGEPYNASVDLYSLGLVLYFLLNNKRLPFLNPDKQILTPNDREQAIRRRLDGETPPAPCDASEDMAQIILCACAYDPNRRFASAKAMKNALLSLEKVPEDSNGSGHSVNKEDGKKAGVTNPVRRKRILIVVIIVIAAAVVCGAVGWSASRRARTEKYNSLVEQQAIYRERGNTAMEEEFFLQAAELVPSGLESYYQHAKMLHDLVTESGEIDYAGCISFIEDNILKNGALDQEDGLMADIYYLYADSLFERGDVMSAADAYKEMYAIGTDDALYVSGYAIALAASGNDVKAWDMLDKAKELGLGEDRIHYTQAEIEKYSGSESEALSDYNFCIMASEDEKLIAMAYLGMADFYRERGDQLSLATERVYLQDAREYDSPMLLQILERLAEVDVILAEDSDLVLYDPSESFTYINEAAGCLEEIIDNGWAVYDTYEELIELYIDMDDMQSAENVLLSMEDLYKEDYRWYRLYACLEYEKQRDETYDDRDFSSFKDNYNRAMELYDSYLESGGSSDSDMNDLQNLYADLKNNGWLN